VLSSFVLDLDKDGWFNAMQCNAMRCDAMQSKASVYVVAPTSTLQRCTVNAVTLEYAQPTSDTHAT
jgi:hypothetical protein